MELTTTSERRQKMLYNDFSEKILGLQGVIIKNVKEKDNNITIKLEIPKKSCKCPNCGNSDNSVHDYRTQQIKDIPQRLAKW